MAPWPRALVIPQLVDRKNAETIDDVVLVLDQLSLVYANKPQTLDHLEDNIRRVIADIRPQMLEKVIENWTSRLDYIRASRGSYMPEIIFKITLLLIVVVLRSWRRTRRCRSRAVDLSLEALENRQLLHIKYVMNQSPHLCGVWKVGEFVSHPQIQPNIFADFFASKNTYHEPIPLDFFHKADSILNKPFHIFEIHRAIKLSKNSTPGADHITASFLKKLDHSGCEVILRYFQNSFDYALNSSKLLEACSHPPDS
ncbi:hypothetical protein TNCV_3203011 [Trichonephila clavipes]|nr:hypothetical protein TNCV_3203011 [Trichonephila clavipes]